MRGLRSFAYGMLAVVLAIALSREGFSAFAIGVLVTVSLLGDLVGTYVIGLVADSWSRRKTMVILALLMAGTAIVFGFVGLYPILLVAAFFGTLGLSASETAPFIAIEQAMLAGLASSARHADVFARYNIFASLAGAAGALSAAAPALLARIGLSLTAGLRLMFVLYAGLALLVAAMVVRLSSGVELNSRSRPLLWAGWKRMLPRLDRSRATVLRLSALFSLDAFAGGLVVQSLMVLYFHLRFGVGLAALGALFFGANLLSAFSFLAAARLARKFGLLNTMVFSHLPSNVLLAMVAVMPTFPLAAVVLLVRQTLSQMDVPTRQAYTMALVPEDERTGAAVVTSIARSTGSSMSPMAAGSLLQGPLLVFGIPFLAAGFLKSAYDLALWLTFREVQLPEDVAEAVTR